MFASVHAHERVCVGVLPWAQEVGRITLIVKLCFLIRPDGRLVRAPQAEALTLDQPLPGQQVLGYPSDFAPYKPLCDLVVVGQEVLAQDGVGQLNLECAELATGRPARLSATVPTRVSAGPSKWFCLNGNPTIPSARTLWGGRAPFDYAHFQSAPAAQRAPLPALPLSISYRRGSSALTARLEHAEPTALVIDRSGSAPTQYVRLYVDTIAIDPTRQMVTVLHRGVCSFGGAAPATPRKPSLGVVFGPLPANPAQAPTARILALPTFPVVTAQQLQVADSSDDVTIRVKKQEELGEGTLPLKDSARPTGPALPFRATRSPRSRPEKGRAPSIAVTEAPAWDEHTVGVVEKAESPPLPFPTAQPAAPREAAATNRPVMLGQWTVRVEERYADRFIGAAISGSGLQGRATFEPPHGAEEDRRLLEEQDFRDRIDHPSLVRTLDRGLLPDGRAFYVEASPSGVSLERWTRDAAFDWAAIVEVLRAVTDFVCKAHEVGLFIGLLAPNLIERTLLNQPFAVRMLRTPLLRRLGDPAPSNLDGLPLAFLAPELLRGGLVTDVRSDLWALGALGYFLLEGASLHSPDEDLPAAALAARRPNAFRAAIGRVPSTVLAVLESAVAQDPRARPLTAEQFRLAISPVVPPPPVPVPAVFSLVGPAPTIRVQSVPRSGFDIANPETLASEQDGQWPAPAPVMPLALPFAPTAEARPRPVFATLQSAGVTVEPPAVVSRESAPTTARATLTADVIAQVRLASHEKRSEVLAQAGFSELAFELAHAAEVERIQAALDSRADSAPLEQLLSSLHNEALRLSPRL